LPLELGLDAQGQAAHLLLAEAIKAEILVQGGLAAAPKPPLCACARRPAPVGPG
jgi:hypothetical protein